jgi:ParB family chromosome partitioning protein
MNTKKKPPSDAFANLIRVARGIDNEEEGQLKTVEQETQERRATLPIDAIKLRVRFKQPRQYFDSAKMMELENSIRGKGIEEPLVVRPLSLNEYELVDGERRYRAAKNIGLAEVPVDIREMDDRQALEYSLTKFLLSEDLNPVEQTQGILNLLSLELECTQEEVISWLYRMQNEVKGKVTTSVTRNVAGNEEQINQRAVIENLFSGVGISWESFVRHRLPLLNLPNEVLESLQQGTIAYTKATAIARIKDEVQRKTLLDEAIAQDLSLTQIKERIASLKSIETETALKSHQPLRSRIDTALRLVKRSKALDDPKKHKRLEKLLSQLEALVADEAE